jgi:hypothetical protein
MRLAYVSGGLPPKQTQCLAAAVKLVCGNSVVVRAI